jgi:hypothetical protein
MKPSDVAGPPLPPNQVLAPRIWPVVGEKAPRRSDDPWSVSVLGEVDHSKRWSLDELRSMPMVEQVIDIHCVTRWSRPGQRFGGVPLRSLLEQCRPRPGAKYLSFIARSERDHSTSLPLVDALDLGTLVAFTHAGGPLAEVHGGPVRTIVPGRYFYKSLKWLEVIRVLDEDCPGYWEAEAGYHNGADPWQEQRYAAPTLDRVQVRELLAKRDFSGVDLRGLDADHRDLAGLVARGATLRDARFRQATLGRACFDGANLSNAHLQKADLRGATFRPHDGRIADLEGADFRGADLRGAIFHRCSLFGATFSPLPGIDDPWGPALIDRTTQVDEQTLATLAASPDQEEFLRQRRGPARSP